MNYEIKKGDTGLAQSYPIMKKNVETGIIVMFIEENQGTCMNSSNLDDLFQFSSTWVEKEFTQLILSITLTQL